MKRILSLLALLVVVSRRRRLFALPHQRRRDRASRASLRATRPQLSDGGRDDPASPNRRQLPFPLMFYFAILDRLLFIISSHLFLIQYYFVIVIFSISVVLYLVLIE